MIAAAVAADRAVRYAAEFARHRFNYTAYRDSPVGRFGEGKHVKRSAS